MSNFSFLKEETFGLRTQATFTENECLIYIPSYFLEGDQGFAEVVGDRIETIGIFWFRVSNKLYHLELPIKIQFQFSEALDSKLLSLDEGMPRIKYNIYKLNKGDAFIWDLNNKEDVSQLKEFFQRLLEGGKIPPDTPYESFIGILLNILSITNIYGKLGVSAVSYEFLISQLCRDRKNASKPFRLTYSGESSSFKYKMMRITLLTRFGEFTSVIGEDLQTGLISSILRTRKKLKDEETPIEKLIKF